MESRIDSGARVAIVGTYRSKATWWKVIYPYDILTVIIIRNVWFFRCAREAASGHLYSTRVLRAQRKKERRKGKGGKKMKRSLYEVRFLKRRRHRFTSDIGSSSSVSRAIGSFDFCLVYLRDTTSRGCVVKGIFEIYNERGKEKRKRRVFSRHEISLHDEIVHKLIITLKNW